jgi:acyl-coenzyme A synthetase/AMP-(fatty) acid ligase
MLSCLHRDYHFSAQDRFLFATSISFDLSIVQIFSPLTCGATMCIATDDTRRDPVALSSFMLDEAVTFTYFTPTQLSLLLEFSADTLRKCHKYRLCFLCGERLPSRLVWAFVDLNLPAEMFNLYGLSETVVQNTSYEIRYGLMSDIVPIWRGLDNSRLYVVDPALHPVPAEMPGELYLGGALLASGYNNLPSKTQNAFLANPFATKEDISQGWTKMFRTGDRTRFLPCGALEFLGRINGDKQVKIRGHRVELGEVENQVRNTPEFGLQFVDVVVVYRSAQEQQEVENEEDKMLIAFLVLRRGLSMQDEQKDTIVNIHTAVSKFLNEYMLPSAYQIVQSLPLLPSGKLDRQKLLTQSLQLIYPFHSASSNNTDSSPIPHVANGSVNGDTSIDPSISTAQAIIQIFHDVLAPSTGAANNKNITPETNFFEAGGNSILMMRLQSRIWKKFSGQVKKVPSLAQMFTKPTPRALAEVMLGVTADDMKWSQLHSLLTK